jgi:4a-hydroxytetrahydrobiopterin dehydratase
MSKLTEPEIASRLPSARGWERHGDMIVRSWLFPTPKRALEFVGQVVAMAEDADHHPDILLSDRRVRLELSTHAHGGLTEQDFSFAAAVNGLPTETATLDADSPPTPEV